MPEEMKVCPFCAEEIREAAIKCRFCHSYLQVDRPEAPVPIAQPDSKSDLLPEPTYRWDNWGTYAVLATGVAAFFVGHAFLGEHEGPFSTGDLIIASIFGLAGFIFGLFWVIKTGLASLSRDRPGSAVQSARPAKETSAVSPFAQARARIPSTPKVALISGIVAALVLLWITTMGSDPEYRLEVNLDAFSNTTIPQDCEADNALTRSKFLSVAVLDADGRTVGSTSFRARTGTQRNNNGSAGGCRWTSKINGIPKSASYTIRVSGPAGPETLDYTLAELTDENWIFTYTIDGIRLE